MMARISSLLRYLRAPSLSVLARDERVVEAAKQLVSLYYYSLPLLAYLFISTTGIAPQFDPHWAIHWARVYDLSYESANAIIRVLFLASAIAGVVWHRKRSARVFVFLALWQLHALESSSLSVNTTWYLYVYTSFILIFLPDVWRESSFDNKRRFLLFVWTAQAAVVLAYTMAGCQKIIYAVIQSSRGETHTFAINAFANQVANNVPIQAQAQATLASYVISYPEVSCIFYIALIFIQLSSPWTLVRPALQRGWAILIVLFHIGAYLTLAVSFPQYILIVSVLFFASPFIPRDVTWRQLLCDLPFVRMILSTTSIRTVGG